MSAGREDPLIGARVGLHRVERAIRDDSLGRVYLAVDPERGDRVAIKVLPVAGTSSPELAARLRFEARLAAALGHGGVLRPLDVGVLDDGRPYLMTEHVEGQPLAALVRGGRAPLGGVAQVMLEVLAALSAMHASRVVHRDLKPDNILVTADGRVKLLDLGVAKPLPGTSAPAVPATRAGALYGTPAYMAPEQASAGEVDARTDVYIAGAVLYECATGRAPFRGEMADLLRQHREEPPPSPRALRPDLPPALEAVILTALAKAPAHRFQSAAAMADALREAASQLPPGEQRPLAPPSGTDAPA